MFIERELSEICREGYRKIRTINGGGAMGEKDYFAKLPDGRYARFLIRFYPRQQRNFVVMESYVNPNPGDRNLEFDARKALKPGSN